MAQEVVVTETLTQEMIQAGEDLLRRLDEANFPMRAALWLYNGTANTWRFMIATPEVRLDGPRKAYKKVQAALLRMKDMPRIGVQNVTVVDTDEPLVKLLRRSLRVVPGSHGRLTKSTLNGHFIEDAYIYRLS